MRRSSIVPEQIVILGLLTALAWAVFRFLYAIIPHLTTGILGGIVEGIKHFIGVML